MRSVAELAKGAQLAIPPASAGDLSPQAVFSGIQTALCSMASRWPDRLDNEANGLAILRQLMAT
jgi:hypothetical protein